MPTWPRTRQRPVHDGLLAPASVRLHRFLGAATRASASFWTDLYAAHADVVLTVTRTGTSASRCSTRPGSPTPTVFGEFVVGTGGEESGSAPSTRLANSEVPPPAYSGSSAQMTLHPGSYDWNFVRDPRLHEHLHRLRQHRVPQRRCTDRDSTASATTISCDASPCTSTRLRQTVTVALSATDSGDRA